MSEQTIKMPKDSRTYIRIEGVEDAVVEVVAGEEGVSVNILNEETNEFIGETWATWAELGEGEDDGNWYRPEG